MSKRTQAGFSLLELLVAMMIIAVLGTLGFKFVRGHTDQARYLKVQDDIRIVSQGLDQYYMRHGRYPDFGSFDDMVKNESPLVKGNFIKTGISAQGAYDQPIEAKSSKNTYEIKFAGDPNAPDERGPIVSTPGSMTVSGPGQGGGDKPEPKAEGAPK